MTPVTPGPAAYVPLVRPGRRRPNEVSMIRRQKTISGRGGGHAFPGGKLPGRRRAGGSSCRLPDAVAAGAPASAESEPRGATLLEGAEP